MVPNEHPEPASVAENRGPEDATPQQWERLKRLTYLLDAAPDLAGPSLSAPDPSGVKYMQSAESNDDLDELHHLVYEMNLVSPVFAAPLDEPMTDAHVDDLDLRAVCTAITRIFRGDRFVEGLLVAEVNRGRVQDLCRRAYSIVNTVDGWQPRLPVREDGRIETGLVFRSLSGEIEGRTTGGRRRCPALARPGVACPNWLVGVLWETGQQLHICSEGWHFDPDSRDLRVVGGGEISARFVTPRPLGEPPLPKSEWPSRAELLKRKAWSARPE